MVFLGNELRSFCRFWGWTQLLHFGLFCWFWGLLHFFYGISAHSSRYNVVLFLVTQLCPTLCDPMDCSPPGSSVCKDSPGKEYWSGLPCHPPGDFPKPGIKPRSPTFQVDSLLSEPPQNPWNNSHLSKIHSLPSILVHWFLRYWCLFLPSPAWPCWIYLDLWT